MSTNQAVETLTSPLPANIQSRRMPRLPVLDGWRGISILLVLCSHMLPLGPKKWDLNSSFGLMGMAVFFTLSGFLITSTLFFHPSVRTFAIRRLSRIVPAAWLFMVIVLTFTRASGAEWSADLLFYTNLPPFHLSDITGHLWSLCVEVQFYLLIGVLFMFLRQRAFVLLPVICVSVTLLRIWTGSDVSIVTYYRVDEILSGATLAWLFHGSLSGKLKRTLASIPPVIPLLCLMASCTIYLPWMLYVRPYCAALLVGTTLFHEGTLWNKTLETKWLKYVATISYALYIWHPLTTHGWFDQGGKMVKYLKRPVGIALSFLMAHVSTFYFEQIWIKLGKRWTSHAKAA